MRVQRLLHRVNPLRARPVPTCGLPRGKEPVLTVRVIDSGNNLQTAGSGLVGLGGRVTRGRTLLNVTQTPLTHVDETGAARMVDVSSKHISVRQATAAGEVRTT